MSGVSPVQMRAPDESRRLRPTVFRIGPGGIPLWYETELEIVLNREGES
jgi:hypothetical protein